jgi:hypothetical protein
MARTHIRNLEREELELWQRKLKALHTHGLGQVGACAEIQEAKRVAEQIEDRPNPKPLPDLAAAAEALIARFGYLPWVMEALDEAQEG